MLAHQGVYLDILRNMGTRASVAIISSYSQMDILAMLWMGGIVLK